MTLERPHFPKLEDKVTRDALADIAQAFVAWAVESNDALWEEHKAKLVEWERTIKDRLYDACIDDLRLGREPMGGMVSFAAGARAWHTLFAPRNDMQDVSYWHDKLILVLELPHGPVSRVIRKALFLYE